MKKIILIVSIAIIAAVVGVLVCLGPKISAGSYPYAEEYEFNMDEASLIKRIQIFKEKHPEYNVPSPEIVDGRRNASDQWYHIYFYYSGENKIVKTWVRSEGPHKSTFAFVAINTGLNLGNWKFINEDFASKENREEKRKFKERILDSLNK